MVCFFASLCTGMRRLGKTVPEVKRMVGYVEDAIRSMG